MIDGLSFAYAVINCIPDPHYPGNSRVLAGTFPGIYRILCPRRPGTYPGLMRGNNSFKRARNLPLDVRISQDSNQRCPGLWGGTYPGICKKNIPLSPEQYPGLYLGHHKFESPGKSPLSPGSGGGRVKN